MYNLILLRGLLSQVRRWRPSCLVYWKTTASLSLPFHISMVSSCGMYATARPAAISRFLILLQVPLESKKQVVKASFRSAFQDGSASGASGGGTGFFGWNPVKKSLASTRNAAERVSRALALRLAAASFKPRGRSAWLTVSPLVGQRNWLVSWNKYSSLRVSGKCSLRTWFL